MKATVEIPDALLREAKKVAEREGGTVRALVEEGLRRVLEDRRRKAFRLRDCSFGGEGLQPGIELGKWEQIRDLIYDGHGA